MDDAGHAAGVGADARAGHGRAGGGADHPLLGDLLLRMAEGDEEAEGERRTVLVVDQLEEVWSEGSDERERESFLDALAGIAHETDARVVLVVRGDYFARWRTIRRSPHWPGTPPCWSALRPRPRCVAWWTCRLAAPAWSCDPGLAETISDDAGQEPGLLPLLSTSLMQLWERRDGDRLTYPDYVAIGGLPGAVAHLAEEAFAALAEPDRARARHPVATGRSYRQRRRGSPPRPAAELEGLRATSSMWPQPWPEDDC